MSSHDLSEIRVDTDRSLRRYISGQSLPEVRVDVRCNAVALEVKVAADLHGVARLALVVVVVHRRLEQECVLA